ncbi:hypothetical protein ACVDG8_007700 [Mesorhizobium sp. ORM8.1]
MKKTYQKPVLTKGRAAVLSDGFCQLIYRQFGADWLKQRHAIAAEGRSA